MSVTDKFKKITGYDLAVFFQYFIDFTSTYYDNYLGYYEGKNELNRYGVELITYLRKESMVIEDLFELNKNSLSQTIDSCDLYDDFSTVKVKIETIISSPKWTRSSYTNDFDKNVNTTQILKYGQTLEDLSYDLGYKSPDDDWVKVAVDNGLTESGYDLGGGNNLKSSFSNNDRINTTAVVAVMSGDSVLGRDLPIRIEISNDDLTTLEPKATLTQAAEILVGLVKGSVPEFPNDGIAGELIGTNVGSFQYPMVFRQLTDSFRKDDTFKELEIIGVSTDQDNVSIQVKVISKLNDVLNKNVFING